MRERILPTHYFHLVFTVPHELNQLILYNKKKLYNIHFHAVADTIKTVLGDPIRLGAKPAFTSMLHTWTQELLYHVHVHSIVSGGGLSPDLSTWIASRDNYLVPVQVLSAVFRAKYVALLQRAYLDREDPLCFSGDAACLADPDEFDRFRNRLFLKDWYVYAKKPLRGPLAVCKYFAQYTHRVGISNKRIVAVTGRTVRFLARHRAKDGTYLGKREISLDVDKFIGRFLLHVLPKGYTRIRHCGLTAPGNIKTRLPLARTLIEKADVFVQPEDKAESDTEATPDPAVCPECGGRMLVRRLIDPKRKDYFDTS
jgi:hypothetical protein